MASGSTPPSDLPASRKRRPPTQIELEATEVPSEAAAPGPAGNAPPPESPSADEQPSEPPIPPPEPETESRRRWPAGWPAFGWPWAVEAWTHVGAGLAGGFLAALLLWLAGVVPVGPGASPDTSARLSSIEQQLKEIANRPTPPRVDPKTIDALAARLSKVEAAQAAPQTPVADPVALGRLGAVENALKSLSDHVTALSHRADAADAARRETDSRLDKLSATLRDVQATARSAAAGSDRASRLAIAAAMLRDAVARGAPFAAELAVVQPLSSDSDTVAALQPFAPTGVPTDATLGKELLAIVRPMLQAAPPSGGSFIDRLQANAENLVRIRPVEAPSGDDRGAVLTRIERLAAKDDIAGSLAELNKLTPEARAPFQSWIAKAEARRKAVDASRRLASDAVAALKAAP
ncbi:MAG TPA: mitofilin family membrane protein [Thermomicrobiales bacterium]|nr:mitofilin family membrane protein [Thermomicrobiales bacterium]